MNKYAVFRERWFPGLIRSIVKEFEFGERVNQAPVARMPAGRKPAFEYGRYLIVYDSEHNVIFVRVRG